MENYVGDTCIENWNEYLDERLENFQVQKNRQPCLLLCIHAFSMVRTIGKGGGGKIVLATRKYDYKHFAIKITSKKSAVKTDCLIRFKNEMEILKAIDFPFVINLEFSFQDNNYWYYAMPFMQGGDLFTLITCLGVLSEDDAKFYAAQIVLALEYLHYLGVVHRDVKIENVLLDSNGYIKLTDFGFAKILPKTRRTYSFCGTPVYLSPEIIIQKGYGFSTDWWSFGVLIYEICSGHLPFTGRKHISLFENIIDCTYRMPVHFSYQLQSLITKLFVSDVSKRIGCTYRGVSDIKDAEWFSSYNWLDLCNKKYKPPYIPNVNGPLDHSLFDDFSSHKLKFSKQHLIQESFRSFNSE
ncbi:hypothetical protein O3M35_003066 [Rhynocoris fuscipes]|uniref:cAMP-dependent protein kinase n=1 Tax=Rhynocoris fuscipes TaxID=488301 RepID=A0AAW1CJ49_9HEMI